MTANALPARHGARLCRRPAAGERTNTPCTVESAPSARSRLLRLVSDTAALRWHLPRWARQRPELVLLVALVAVFNLPLLFGGCWRAMMFHSIAVTRGGEWWRLITHPLVHVTWYHLLLDGTAFLTLYYGLFEKSCLCRLAYVVAGAAGSLACSWACAANSAQGLCGLSGIAHGLMAVSAVEMIVSPSSDRATRRVGWCSFVLVTLKGAFEALSGRMFFAFLDFGMLGDPVAVSHAGGVIGSLTLLLIMRRGRR